MGEIGRAVASRLAAFEVRVLYSDTVSLPKDVERAAGLTRVSTTELLATSDFVMPLLHLTPESYHLVGSQALSSMRRGALLVNLGRGSVVDEKAVAASLAEGHLGGYAADVFEMEDWAIEARPREINPALLADRSRTVFTPHLGSAVGRVRHAIELEAAQNVIDVFSGRRPRGAVNDVEVSRPQDLVPPLH
jgi:phosphonate dehydrogenase